MHGYEDKNKVHYYLYEFLGTVIVTVGYNITSSSAIPILLIVSLWSWEKSAAHFNAALTIGEFMMTIGDPQKMMRSALPTLFILLVQFLGALAGIFVTYLCSRITTDAATNIKTTQPTVPVLCPGDSTKCATDSLQWSSFSVEVLASCAFVFTWLIVRYFKAPSHSSKWMSLLGPFIVY
jgi:hypothetical protein